jgi:ABC-type polysaccharide/polyol phosphate transport system ATPase subunit
VLALTIGEEETQGVRARKRARGPQTQEGSGLAVASLVGVSTAPHSEVAVTPAVADARPIAVTVESLDKTFRIPHQQASTLKERVLHPFRSSSYDALEALQQISLEVREGEFFGIVGRNGSGKSTLLKCLAGIYEPTAGSVDVRGRLATFIELGVGFNPELAARDNVIINATMLGLTRREAAARFDEILAFAELEQFVDLKLKNYSSGMHVRLAFATAVQVDADVLVVDEVLAVGDAAFQQKCYEQFQRLKDDGRTILFVTHDMGAVERFCDRAMLLEKGRIEGVGDPATIGREYHQLNFNRPATAAVDDARRHGDQREAEIQSVWLEQPEGNRAEALLTGDQAVICFELVAREDIDNPTLQVTLRNEAHQAVFIASSDTDQVRAEPLAGGRRYIVKLHFDCYVGTGRYAVSPALLRGATAADIIDLREDLGSFMVHSVNATGGIAELPHRFEVQAP